MSLIHSWLSFDAKARPDRLWQFAHGEHCACLILAAAVGARPDTVSCDYCRNVLQKHWEVACDHGHRALPGDSASASERWHDLGEIDPVKALVIKEA